MAFGKRNEVEVPQEDTKIWVCSSEDCNAWVRDNFTSGSSEVPECPICHSPMVEETKVLHVVDNHTKRFFEK